LKTIAIVIKITTTIKKNTFLVIIWVAFTTTKTVKVVLVYVFNDWLNEENSRKTI